MQAQYHADMTRTALAPYFGPEALQEIISANVAQDSLLSNIGCDPHRHFCARDIARSHAYIEAEHALIQEMSRQPGRAAEQRAALGRLLHTAQDFYAHTNYVELWLSVNGGPENILPHQIDGLDGEIMHHPDLRIGEWVPWRDMVYYLPLVGRLARRLWLPRNSHEAINLDSPERGPYFVYALATAQQRTTVEYQRALTAIAAIGGQHLVDCFHQTRPDVSASSPQERKGDELCLHRNRNLIHPQKKEALRVF